MPRPHDKHCPHKGSPRFERSPITSSSYRNRLARAMPEREEPPPPPPEPDLIVTGTLSHDATGFYDEAGVHNGQPYYERTDGAWFIWYLYYPFPPAHKWVISTLLGDFTTAKYQKSTANFEPVTGDYTPMGGATGTATVATP